MNRKKSKIAIANKIKKWLKTIKELQDKSRVFAISITRLTSIKSLCDDAAAAHNFALYLSRKTQKEMKIPPRNSSLALEEWDTHENTIEHGIDLMQNYLQSNQSELLQSIRELLRQINRLQGDDYRNVYWNTTVHFLKSGYLLRLEYALRCFIDSDYPF